MTTKVECILLDLTTRQNNEVEDFRFHLGVDVLVLEPDDTPLENCDQYPSGSEARRQCLCEHDPTDCPLDVLYYHHSDQLGSASVLTDVDGNPYQFFLYLPWGEVLVEQNVAQFSTPYQFNGKELDRETGLYNYGARYYDPSISVWLGVDPLADAPLNVNWSPYAYGWNNPIANIDPDGRHTESTIVGDNGDGTYTVEGWIDDNKTDVILKGGTKVGNSLTTHSFLDEHDKPVIGAIIDTKSSEGQNFIDDEIVAGDPNLFDYAAIATINLHYDFKSRGLKDGTTDEEALVHRTRGSMTSDGEMASARDFGNVAAGIVSTRNGVPVPLAKYKFNQLQGGQEPPVSSKAQAIGFQMGREIGKQDAQRFREWRRANKSCRGCNR